ncbi:WASH complex subunit 3 isoform X1 [Neodiprion fabricii]|uniref:WASH complex subunit 3 isoform X1 n=1 Tax=Neodiprion fabricii TaxID=2872261 RepID=UPI001ED91058|nr:WASH complex subunit 3 isoform X1 [Neodiprion fabricii]XP_046417913.1 WASH complex subunit 3 isoform X1 [Neodiprion fabricii]
MNDYGIPMIEPTVDFTKVPPIHQKRTITFVNHFIVHTVTFLNKFALSCEEKLFEFENKLQKVEASLGILESRLASIPEIDFPTKTESSPITESSDQKQKTVEQDQTNEIEAVKAELIDERSEISNTQPISKDPRYAKFFKMLQFGVPAQAVKLKMKQEGLDPLLLDNPDQLVPITEIVETNTTTDEDDA